MPDEEVVKALRPLAKAGQDLRDALEHRDQAIIAAWRAGYSLREIGDTVGMSHRAVSKLLERHKIRKPLSPEEVRRGKSWG